MLNWETRVERIYARLLKTVDRRDTSPRDWLLQKALDLGELRILMTSSEEGRLACLSCLVGFSPLG